MADSFASMRWTLIVCFLLFSNLRSGEVAFKALSHGFGWAKTPFIKRVAEIDPRCGSSNASRMAFGLLVFVIAWICTVTNHTMIPFLVARIVSNESSILRLYRIPITFVYGSHTWMDSSMGPATQDLRRDSQVDVHVIPRAGHHVYAGIRSLKLHLSCLRIFCISRQLQMFTKRSPRIKKRRKFLFIFICFCLVCLR
jgi:hypothetical protein